MEKECFREVQPAKVLRIRSPQVRLMRTARKTFSQAIQNLSFENCYRFFCILGAFAAKQWYSEIKDYDFNNPDNPRGIGIVINLLITIMHQFVFATSIRTSTDSCCLKRIFLVCFSWSFHTSCLEGLERVRFWMRARE